MTFFNKVINFFKNNFQYILAFVIGFLIVFPSLHFHFFESGYKGIELLGADGEQVYVAEIREMYDGHYGLGNIYLADQKSAAYLQQPLSPFIVFVLGKTLGISAINVNMVTKFLFPALLTLLVYAFFNELTKKKSLALLLTAFIMMAPATLTFLNPGAWIPFAKGIFTQSDYLFISYSRPLNPQVSSLFYFAYLLCIWKYLFGNGRRIYGILSTIILGLSFYTYFFAFSFLFALNGAMGLGFLFTKRWTEFKKIFWVSLVASLIGIPYFVNSIRAFHSPGFTDASHRFGSTETRQFVFSRVWWGCLIILILSRRFLERAWFFFLLAWLAAAFIVTNQQIITGHIAPIPSHYHWYYVAPISGALLIYFIYLFLQKYINKWVTGGAVVFLALLFFWSGILFQKQSYDAHLNGFISQQRYADAVKYLDKNIPVEKTVFANDIVSNLLPMYTGLNIYQLGGMGDSLVSTDR